MEPEIQEKTERERELTRIGTLVDEATEIVEALFGAFGEDDPRAAHAAKMLEWFLVDPTEYTVQVALMYLKWCAAHPARIGKPSERLKENDCGECKNHEVCESGFILEDEESNTWRPCHRMLTRTHDNWVKETGYSYR